MHIGFSESRNSYDHCNNNRRSGSYNNYNNDNSITNNYKSRNNNNSSNNNNNNNDNNDDDNDDNEIAFTSNKNSSTDRDTDRTTGREKVRHDDSDRVEMELNSLYTTLLSTFMEVQNKHLSFRLSLIRQKKLNKSHLGTVSKTNSGINIIPDDAMDLGPLGSVLTDDL